MQNLSKEPPSVSSLIPWFPGKIVSHKNAAYDESDKLNHLMV